LTQKDKDFLTISDLCFFISFKKGQQEERNKDNVLQFPVGKSCLKENLDEETVNV
jgi:hypothetical protein